MRSLLLTAASCSLFASALMAETSAALPHPKTAEAEQWFVDTKLVYQQGSALSRSYLNLNAQDFLTHKLNAIYPWLVRIEVRHTFEGNGYSSNHGTGTLLKGGKVITAKHVITAHREKDSRIEVILTTVDGQSYSSSVSRLGETDWAVLQIENTARATALHYSPLEIATPIEGETAVFLGYPARLGLDGKQKVQSFNPGDASNEILASKLYPMPVVGSVRNEERFWLTPLAGFPPVGGMSGGPIFNLKGQLIAVQKSISTTTDDLTGAVVSYEINGEHSSVLKLESPKAEHCSR